MSATSNADGSAVKTGWTGVVPNNAHLTWKVEFLHVDLGSNNFSFSASGLFSSGSVIPVSSRFSDDIACVGADYHF